MGYPIVNLKLIVVGDFAVGKTSLCKRFALGSFKEDYKPTIGVDIYSSRFEIPNKAKVVLNIWDTAGQERFRKLYPKYYKGAKAALVVYDITSRPTFESVPEWVNSIRKNVGDIPIVLVGNKADLEPYRRVKKEEGEEMAKKLDLGSFIETSAKSGENVDKPFRMAVNVAISRILEIL